MIEPNIQRIIDKTYDPCVGQQRVKTKMRFDLTGLAHRRVVPNTLFSSERGSGKTMFARETMKAIADIRKNAHGTDKVRMIEVNGASLKSLKVFFDMVREHIMDREAVLFIDEVHNIAKSVTSQLLTIAAPNKSKVTTCHYDGSDFTFDFRHFSIIAATTEPQNVFKALRDRFSEVNLEAPTAQELAEIMRRNLEDCAAQDEALLALSPYCRGNCRSAVKMAENISNYCANLDKPFLENDVLPLVKIVDVYPLGLMPQEVAILKYLARDGHQKMKTLCAKTGLTGLAQQDSENFLLRHGLMTIDGDRNISARGVQYLKELGIFERPDVVSGQA